MHIQNFGFNSLFITDPVQRQEPDIKQGFSTKKLPTYSQQHMTIS